MVLSAFVPSWLNVFLVPVWPGYTFDKKTIDTYIDFMIDFEENRDDLSKYFYDLSKIVIAVAVLNRLFVKDPNFLEIVFGTFTAFIFLLVGIVLKKGD